jgi:hypothetical protein
VEGSNLALNRWVLAHDVTYRAMSSGQASAPGNHVSNDGLDGLSGKVKHHQHLATAK